MLQQRDRVAEGAFRQAGMLDVHIRVVAAREVHPAALAEQPSSTRTMRFSPRAPWLPPITTNKAPPVGTQSGKGCGCRKLSRTGVLTTAVQP